MEGSADQNQKKVSIVIIDDHPLFRQGVEDVLRLEVDFEIVGRASSGLEGLSLIRMLRPQIGTTDVNLPDLNGLMVVRHVTQEHLPTRMILLTAYDDMTQKILAFLSGAWGYCTKDIQPIDFVNKIRVVLNGFYIFSDEILTLEELRRWLAWQTKGEDQNEITENLAQISPLSPREMEVLSWLTLGQSNKEIAHQMGISHQTVKNHLASLFRKLGVDDRTQAVLYALQMGWIRMPAVESEEYST